MTKATRQAPRPGRPVRSSKTGRPIMALLDLVGRRWVLRIVWELRGSALNFRALQQACGDISPSVLNQRLADLRETALVELGADGYALTPLGREFEAHFLPLTVWAAKWARELKSPNSRDRQ